MANDRPNLESAAFTRSAAWCDAVHGRRHDDPAKIERLTVWIDPRKTSAGNRLLDIACGAGADLPSLAPAVTTPGSTSAIRWCRKRAVRIRATGCNRPI